MSQKKLSTRGPIRKKQAEILIFAENKHDSDAIKCLAESLNPTLSARLVVQRDPTSLTRDARHLAVKSWMERIAGTVEARSRLANVVCVLVHQDSDGPDPNHTVAESLSQTIRTHLSVAGHAVVPVQEMESWWFLYPDSLRSVNRIAWKDLKLPQNRNTDGLESPKERLIRLTRSTRRNYTEADSLAVAQAMANAIARGESPSNTSTSWNRFAAMVQSL